MTIVDNPHRCVIDSDGYYVEFVLLTELPDGNAAPYAYTLKPGETLIEASPPSGMIKPHWTGDEWEETAPPEEIEAAKPAPSPPAPLSDIELLAAEMSMAMAAMQQQTDMAIAELTMAIAAGQGEVNPDV